MPKLRRPVEVMLTTPSLYVSIAGKRCTVSFSDEEGIFIASQNGTPLEITAQSEVKTWLFIKPKEGKGDPQSVAPTNQL
uniref:Uncharacterized protein n=1 Tax=viral metagenome TaxID=1070528 RepID=A0A6H2A097_9ZZZZ